MSEPNENNEIPEEHSKSSTNETLQQKSARLEAKAAGGKFYPEHDPLSPEPEPEPENIQVSGDLPNEDGLDTEAQAKIESLQKELDKTKDQMLRAIAEAENSRRRGRKERDDASKYSIAAFAKDLLDVADNLRRGLESVSDDLMDDEPRIKNLIDGIEATERALLKSFDQHKIRKLDPIDKIFDPNFHEVMFEVPGTGKPPGTIMQVIDVGYILDDRLLRPARVGVAKDEGQAAPGGAPPPPASPGGQIDTEI